MRLYSILLFALGISSCRITSEDRGNEMSSIISDVGIPKKIHQVWIGQDKEPDYNQYYKESMSKHAPNHEYKLWTNKDLTRENFPIVYDYILQASEAGKRKYGVDPKMWNGTPTRKLAQISDLMRLEIIYHHGGFYFDVKTELLKSIDHLSTPNISFVVANEDPCGLTCKSGNKLYLSNSIFASAPNSMILQRLLKKDRLEQIKFDRDEVNEETGPFYFRSGILNANEVHLLKTDEAFPYISWTSPYQKAGVDRCLSKERDSLKTSDDHVKTIIIKNETVYLEYPCEKYPTSLLVMHWNLGGTWK